MERKDPKFHPLLSVAIRIYPCSSVAKYSFLPYPR